MCGGRHYREGIKVESQALFRRFSIQSSLLYHIKNKLLPFAFQYFSLKFLQAFFEVFYSYLLIKLLACQC